MNDHVAAVAALDEPNRRRLYDFVVRQTSPISKDEVSEAIGLPRTTAAFHLDKLASRSESVSRWLAASYRRSGSDTSICSSDRR